MTIEQALIAIRSWRGKPAAVEVLLAAYERMQRELQEARRR